MTILDNGYILDGMNTFECEIKRLIDLFVCILLCSDQARRWWSGYF